MEESSNFHPQSENFDPKQKVRDKSYQHFKASNCSDQQNGSKYRIKPKNDHEINEPQNQKSINESA